MKTAVFSVPGTPLTDRQEPPSPSRGLPAARVVIIVVLSLTLSFLYRHVFIDDAFIYARYVANALRGWGLVFNQDEHVNALTSPLYSYLVLGAAKLSGADVFQVSIFVSAVGFLFACLIAEAIAPFAGLLLCSTSYFYTLFGMETSLFLALLLLPVLLLQKRREIWIPTAAVLLVLTRFEGAALLPPLLYALYKRRRWPALAAYGPPVALSALYLALNRHWYGALLPASAGAKLGQGRSGFWGAWPRAFLSGAYQLKPDFLPILPAVLAVLLLILLGSRRLWRTTLVQVSLPFLVVLLSFYVLFNLPGYRWYFAPFIAFGMVYACAALPSTGPWRWAVIPLVLFAAVSAIARAHPFAPASAQTAPVGYPAVGFWLATHTPPGTRVEAGEIGTLGWFCQGCRILDILGLTLPKNAIHVAHKDAVSWLAEDRPEYVVVHTPAWGFEDVALASSAYQPVPVDFGPAIRLLRRVQPTGSAR